jgi:two-component system, chemotaxis family, protein-glutamate methylesterase/glutaminase
MRPEADPTMQKKDIVVVGASAGGIEALSQLVSNLPARFSGKIFVVVHVPEDATSVLPRILSRRGSLPAAHPRDGDRIANGRIYVAPPNYHMLLEGNHIRLVHGPREHGTRPAVDPLFRSAALSFAARVVAVIMSGNLDDGTSGLEIVKAKGGIGLAQDPDEAAYTGMITSAIRSGCVDEVLPAAKIAARLAELAGEPAEEEEKTMAEAKKTNEAEKELAIDELAWDQLHSDDQPGTVSAFVCPDCNGTLWELSGGETLRYRCRVGHAFAIDSLLARHRESIETAFWVALRALEERGWLLRRLVRRSEESGQESAIRRYNEEAEAVAQRAKMLRDTILSGILTNGADERTA